MKISENETNKLWGGWKIIWANTKNLCACLELVCSGKIDGIGLSPHSGSDIFDLKSFSEWNELKGIVLPYAKEIDLSDLGQINFLKFLVIGESPCPIDISGFSSLSDLSIDWSEQLRLPTFPSSLVKLRIDGFSPADRNLTELSRFSRLSQIELVKGNLDTLEGCNGLEFLLELKASYLSRLKIVKSLSKTSVQKVFISNCRSIMDLDSLVDCRNLEVLHYHDSAPLKSIDFIRKCPMLREFRFVGVDVFDGDMTPLLGLERFAFTRKKHFSHSEKMLKELQIK